MLVEHASVAKPFASPSLRLKSLGRCPCFATVNCLRNTAVKVVAPTGVEPVSIASYPLLLSQPPSGVCGLDFLITVARNTR